MLQHNVKHCNTLQHTAAHCSTLQHTATHCNTLRHTADQTRCNALQRTATPCNTLQHTHTCTKKRAKDGELYMLQCVAVCCRALQHTHTHKCTKRRAKGDDNSHQVMHAPGKNNAVVNNYAARRQHCKDSQPPHATIQR